MTIPKPEELFDLRHTISKDIFDGCEAVFQAITKIKDFCIEISNKLDDSYVMIAPDVWAAKDAKISDKATIIGPAIIGHNTEIRPGAYIRGSVIIGDDAIIGNSTEIKNSIIFDEAQLPHYNYVGDSIIGYRAHMGAGSIISNVRLDHNNVSVKANGEKIDTGLRKMGVLLGDRAEIGCNSVICPGSIIGRDSIIYPLSRISGIIPQSYYFYGDERAPKPKFN